MSRLASDYRKRDSALPDMGNSGLGPRSLTSADVDAILACADVAALAQMRGYARSFFATGGAVVIGASALIVGALLGRREVAVPGALMATAATLVTVEARRRARQWESVIDAAINGATAGK